MPRMRHFSGNDIIKDQAENSFLAAQKWFLASLKDVQCVSALTRSSTSDSSTKKEPVKLPKFEGAESASPFLKFPVWIDRWEKLIVQYGETWRPSILLDHLDDAARERFVGYENNYSEAMDRLKKYYGDPQKVVSCVMKEVLSPSDIKYGDYVGLLSYVDILERNHNRLKHLNIEHEISNTSTMTQIVRKLPRIVSEKWIEHLSQQGDSVKSRPFPEFMTWLISMRFIWEQMVTVDQKSGSSSSSFFGMELKENSNIKCFKCREPGHKRADCPKKVSADQEFLEN